MGNCNNKYGSSNQNGHWVEEEMCLTPEVIKDWYECNLNTNVFTDDEKTWLKYLTTLPASTGKDGIKGDSYTTMEIINGELLVTPVIGGIEQVPVNLGRVKGLSADDVWNYTYYADEGIDRVLGMNTDTMELVNEIALDPSRVGVHAGSCDRAGYTNKMYVRTPKLNDSYSADGTGSMQVLDVAQSKWIKNIPLINPPRSSGGYNKYRGLQGITGKTEPRAMIIDVATDTVVINAGTDHTTETIAGNDGGNATGHFIWLDANHFALLDRFRNSVFIYKINEDFPPYTTTLTDTIVTPTSSHSFVSKAGAGHLLSERIFYLAVEGSSATKDDVKPQLGKFKFDSATGTMSQIGTYLEFTTLAGTSDNLHHFGFARNGTLMGVPMGNSGKVFIVDLGAENDQLKLWVGGINEYTAGHGAGHFDFSDSQDKAAVTNHKDNFVTIIDLAAGTSKNISFATSGVVGSDFIQSHRNWILDDGKTYVFFEAVDGIFYKINLVNDTLDSISTQTGGIPVQSTS